MTQKETAWAIGIPIASYIRLERGQVWNPPLGWLMNAAIVLECAFDDLLEEQMKGWYRFARAEPPPPEWYTRPEVLARAKRWDEFR